MPKQTPYECPSCHREYQLANAMQALAVQTEQLALAIRAQREDAGTYYMLERLALWLSKTTNIRYATIEYPLAEGFKVVLSAPNRMVCYLGIGQSLHAAFDNALNEAEKPR